MLEQLFAVGSNRYGQLGCPPTVLPSSRILVPVRRFRDAGAPSKVGGAARSASAGVGGGVRSGTDDEADRRAVATLAVGLEGGGR